MNGVKSIVGLRRHSVNVDLYAQLNNVSAGELMRRAQEPDVEQESDDTVGDLSFSLAVTC